MMIRIGRGCGWYRKLIGMRHDGVLPVRRARELDGHLSNCESCRVAQDLARVLSSEMQSWDGAAPSPEFDDRVMRALASTPQRTGWAGMREFAFGAVAAGVLMAVAIQYAAREEGVVRAPASPSSTVDLQTDDLLTPILENRNTPFWHRADKKRQRSEVPIKSRQNLRSA